MPSVLAIAAHPDDIEFGMAGTLLQLQDRGWQLHYFNLANGCCGSMTLPAESIAAERQTEARAAAKVLGAHWYPPLCPDLEIQFTPELLRQVASVIRRAQPEIVLTHSPQDYMEDHEQTARLAVSAAFARGMPNFETVPSQVAWDQPIAIYHAQPHGNRNLWGELVRPHLFVDISISLERKLAALACHKSQQGWLSQSQQLNSYLNSMQEFSAEVGRMSGVFPWAEGWRQRHFLGFSAAGFAPLQAALGAACRSVSETTPLA